MKFFFLSFILVGIFGCASTKINKAEAPCQYNSRNECVQTIRLFYADGSELAYMAKIAMVQAGVSSIQISPISYGEEKPKTSKTHQETSRLEIVYIDKTKVFLD